MCLIVGGQGRVCWQTNTYLVHLSSDYQRGGKVQINSYLYPLRHNNIIINIIHAFIVSRDHIVGSLASHQLPINISSLKGWSRTVESAVCGPAGPLPPPQQRCHYICQSSDRPWQLSLAPPSLEHRRLERGKLLKISVGLPCMTARRYIFLTVLW